MSVSPIEILTCDDLRKPVRALLDAIITQHIGHHLTDDFLILTPDMTSAQDLSLELLEDPRLGGVLTGSSLLSFPQWIQHQLKQINPKARMAPRWVHEKILLSCLNPNPKSDLLKNLSHEAIGKNLLRLFTAFRNEAKSPAHLGAFLNDLSPDFAEDCNALLQRYQKKIETHPLLMDPAEACHQTIRAISSSHSGTLNPIRKIYWFGFLELTPWILKTMQALTHLKDLKQIVLLQKPHGKNIQDLSLWEVFQGPAITDLPATERTHKPKLLKFPTPFAEAGFVVQQILDKVKEGIAPAEMALFLPQNPFWRDYFETLLSQAGIGFAQGVEKPLACFSPIRSSFGMNMEEALSGLEKCQEEMELLYSEKQAMGYLRNESWADMLSQELRALSCWKNLLEEARLYQHEFPQAIGRISLSSLAQGQTLPSIPMTHNGICLRSHRMPGLKKFKFACLFGLNAEAFPKSPDYFLGLPLPSRHTRRSEKAILQQLLDAAENETLISHSSILMNGKETSPSSLLADFNLKEWNQENHPSLYPHHCDLKDLQARLEMEIFRQKNSETPHPHSGQILNSSHLKILSDKMQDHVFTPSQLQDYQTCPFRFFASNLLHLKVEPEESPEGSHLDRGNWVHRFLEVFFQSNQESIHQSLFKTELRKPLIHQIEPKLREFTKGFLKEKPWIDEMLSEDFCEKMKRMIEMLLETFWEKMAQTANPYFPTYFEFAFGQEGKPPLEIKGEGKVSLKIRGRVDRIDFSKDRKSFIVYDYKTGSVESLNSEIRTGKYIQLPVYVLAIQTLLKESVALGGMLLDLKDFKFNQGLIQKGKDNPLLVNGRSQIWYDEQEWEDCFIQLKSNLLKAYENILKGNFSPKPDPCDPYCDYKPICRYHDTQKTNT